jgi:hypothetical protein
MDGTTVDGTNASLNDPIGKAVRYLGYTVTNPVLVSDADVAQVTDDETDQFLDIATYYTLNNVLGNLDDVEIRVGPRSEKYQQLAEQLERKLERMKKQLENEYGFGYTTPQPGYITLNIAEHDT